MAKRVGFVRSLKLEWLNRAAELATAEGKTSREARAVLNADLTSSIASAISREKVLDELINAWYGAYDEAEQIRASARTAFTIGKTNPLVLHWCLLLLVYPIFADVATLIGKITQVQDQFSTAWIRTRIYETWGMRSILDVSVCKILKTLVDFKVLDKVKTGVYVVRKCPVLDDSGIELILRTILARKQKAYYEIADLSTVPQMFPFAFDVTHEWLYKTGTFMPTQYGDRIVLTT